MLGASLITRTKFIPPRRRASHVERPRLAASLLAVRDHRIVAVCAGPGYGKTSAVAALLEQPSPDGSTDQRSGLWYALTERDADPQVFLLHLAHLLAGVAPLAAAKAAEILSQPGGASQYGQTVSDLLADAVLGDGTRELWLVLDDVHHLNDATVTLALLHQWLSLLPPTCHVVLVGRSLPALPEWSRWVLHGDAISLGAPELSFDPVEIGALAGLRGLALSSSEVDSLWHETGGWPIAVQLLIDEAVRLGRLPSWQATAPGNREAWFDYVATQILDDLPSEDLAFLAACACLPRLAVAWCARLTDRTDAERVLREASKRGLPIRSASDHAFEFHGLFRDALLQRLERAGTLQAHRLAAAAVLREVGEAEGAVDVLLQAGETTAAAALLVDLAPGWVAQDRHGTLMQLVAPLPEAILHQWPALLLSLAESSRRSCAYVDALNWFTIAATAFGPTTSGGVQALIGQALVHLDTVQPRPAALALQAALTACRDDDQRMIIEQLLNDNALNAGHSSVTDPVATETRDTGTHDRHARRLLRTGKVAEAARYLEGALSDPQIAAGGHKGHRQESLVLAYAKAMLGDASGAIHWASLGEAQGTAAGSLVTQALAVARQGHGYVVDRDWERAETAYRRSLAQIELLHVSRLTVEPCFGLALVSSHAGDHVAAMQWADRGRHAAAESGDTWLTAYLDLIRATLRITTGDSEPEPDLQAAARVFTGTDAFGTVLVEYWRHRHAIRTAQAGAVEALIPWRASVQTMGLGVILERPTLFGFLDEADRLPAPHSVTATDDQSRATDVMLSIRTFGGLSLQFHGADFDETTFSRRKAKQLLCLLLAERDHWVPKARICDQLWPDLDGDRADGTFRVVLNALQGALRLSGPGSAQANRLVVRRGTLYRLCQDDRVRIDASDFLDALNAAEALDRSGGDAIAALQTALGHYGGAFLADVADDLPACDVERSRLAQRYTQAALRLAELKLTAGDAAGAVTTAETLVERDPLVEAAYRILIQGYLALGDRGLAKRTLDRCQAVLADELGVAPMPATIALLQSTPSVR